MPYQRPNFTFSSGSSNDEPSGDEPGSSAQTHVRTHHDDGPDDTRTHGRFQPYDAAISSPPDAVVLSQGDILSWNSSFLRTFHASIMATADVHSTRHDRNADFDFLGDGIVTDKQDMLRRKTPTLHAIGFQTTHRVVLAQDFLEDILLKSGLKGLDYTTLDTQEAPLSLTIDDVVEAELRDILRDIPPGPVLIRSSVLGDSRGTGIYESELCPYDPEDLSTFFSALQKVLRSYFTPSARAFRDDMHTSIAYDVIVEPLIQDSNLEAPAPLLSGMGYTSTAAGPGYITVVPGMSGGVLTRYPEYIKRNDLEGCENLRDYVMREYITLLGRISDASHCEKPSRRQSSLIRCKDAELKAIFPLRNVRGSAFDPSAEGYVADAVLIHEASKTYQAIDLRELFAMLDRVEKAFGKPQYVEWALTMDKDGKPVFWINQIDDVDANRDVIDFGDSQGRTLEAHSVVGSGVKSCNDVVVISQFVSAAELKAFNDSHDNYVLVYPAELVSGSVETLSYDVVSRAGAIIEYRSNLHAGDPAEHWKGRLEASGKFFGILNDQDAVMNNLPSIMQAMGAKLPPANPPVPDSERRVPSIASVSGSFRVAASAAQNRLVVDRVEERD